MVKDRLARYVVAVGGIGVIVAITLIFFYLVSVVIPLFQPAGAGHVASFPVPGDQQSASLYLAMEEQAEVGMRIAENGEVVFFAMADGRIVNRHTLPIPEGAHITSLGHANLDSALVAIGLSNGQAIVFKHAYQVTFPNDQRLISPMIEFPFGMEPLDVDPAGNALRMIAFQSEEGEATMIASDADGAVHLLRLIAEEGMSDDISLDVQVGQVSQMNKDIAHILLTNDQRQMYIIDSKGFVHYLDISDIDQPEPVQSIALVAPDKQLTSVQFLNGGHSLLVGDSSGSIIQWFLVRNEYNQHRLTKIRSFHEQSAPITHIAAEYFRKGFVAVDQSGVFSLYHATAHRKLLSEPVTVGEVRQLALGPRSNTILLEDGAGQLHVWHLENEHPEVSWSSLWGKVWYEGYPEPEYVWQSSAASETFEPKLSLAPIAFGTLKAAFYAMLLAIPLAVMGAIYTAHFMTVRMRTLVKPSIEIMEALPTVILGFLAGLWLAPFVEKYLTEVFSLLLILPLGILVTSYGWKQLPTQIRTLIPEGWEAALLMLPLLIFSWLAFVCAPLVEQVWFDGNMIGWLEKDLGIDFDQRNSIIVGLAMGFAVIPTIFSITEDAIFAVPKHLSYGSLALGATPWQTLWRVVLLTASPGIFSAVMIGFGRAVGETMIVLMATGNTPVMDMSMFQGMRTMSANIAVEIPESEVDSTHYRVLFLAGLVLFVFTFFFNTLAEVVRQRLRRKYSSL